MIWFIIACNNNIELQTIIVASSDFSQSVDHSILAVRMFLFVFLPTNVHTDLK